jgi:hypothetical protein
MKCPPDVAERLVKVAETGYGITLDQLVEMFVAEGVFPPKPEGLRQHPKRTALGRWRSLLREGVEGRSGPIGKTAAAIITRVLQMSRREQVALAKQLQIK